MAVSKLIKTKDGAKLDHILWILDKYDGRPDVLKIVKEIVKNFEVTQELRLKLYDVLSNTPALMGEYGLVRAYEEKINDMKSWETDPDERIAVFAKSYVEYLTNSIKYEKARVDQDVEIRKSEFDRFKAMKQ